MRIAIAQIAYGDEESPADRVDRVSALVESIAPGHDLVVLPELWMPTGFGYEGWDAVAQPVQGPFVARMAEVALRTGVTLHAGSFVERLPHPGPDGHLLANTAVVLGADGELVAAYRKIHRFGFGSGEPKLMEAGEDIVVSQLPAGDDRRVLAGLSTCYDLRFPELYRAQVEQGAEMFVIPAAWPLPRVGHWQLLGRARAIENQCFVVQCNTGGRHHGGDMGGGSQVIAPTGEVLAVAPDNGEHVLSVEIDLGLVASYRRDFPVLADRRL